MLVDLFCPHCGVANPLGNAVCSVCARPVLLKQRYQILTKLGQGGFAAVYKAKDLQFSSAFRAIKEMDEAQLGPQEKQEAITAFQQEAHILARLMHPNLPRIYDHFEEQQRWYLVMDYIDGETLEQVLTKTPQGKLPVEQVIQYALQLCTVLNYLHTQVPPIIFRDLKPSNILITLDDHLYLIDFGIARFFKPGKVKDTVALGSPGYAAPEQYGKAQTTALADIYSLGATLHHLLSGRDPSDDPFTFPSLQFEPPNSMTKALADLVAQMVTIERVKRPASVLEIQQTLSATTLQRVNPSVQIQSIVSARSRTNTAPSARQSSNIGPQGSLMWSFPTSGSVTSSPTVVNGMVYFGSWNHNFYALDASSSRRIWCVPTESYVSSSPTVANGIVYFGSHDGNLYALDTASGQQMWSFLSRNAVTSSPTVVNGVVYFGSYDHNLYALDAASGQKIWSFPTDRAVSSSPTVVDGTIFFGSLDGNLYALDASSGQKLWSFLTGNRVTSSPTVVDGTIFFGSHDHSFYVLKTSSGQKLWSFASAGGLLSSPTVANGMVYFGSGGHSLYALAAFSGLHKWSFSTSGLVDSSAAVVNGAVYFGSWDGNLYALDAASGQKIWSFPTRMAISSSPTVVNGVVYFGSRDGKLYAIFA